MGRGAALALPSTGKLCVTLWQQSKGRLLLEGRLTALISRTMNINSSIVFVCLNKMAREGGKGLGYQKWQMSQTIRLYVLDGSWPEK